ncbi:hypothetical protein GTY75_05220 [Streptomyces sp. SID8381]|uniref:hypothetical protein n=1 Tax=unclassified Streptomyces TaxID=2593676 RepID=UPI00038193BE|nr:MULTISPECIES: hypothetical protein [unclassified Streptomyces]MYX26074.1 hypothetical protein [Streptomyces sp. SID8381]
MGLTKSFHMDREELGVQAANAALLDSSTDRFIALTAAFEEAGGRAAQYHDPAHALAELVNGVVFDYRAERRVIENERIAEGV